MGTKREKKGDRAHDSSEPWRGSEALGSGTGLDELDAAIPHYLERHGQPPTTRWAKRWKLSASAASRRILALDTAGAILSSFYTSLSHFHWHRFCRAHDRVASLS
jgi:hypothetical protein